MQFSNISHTVPYNKSVILITALGTNTSIEGMPVAFPITAEVHLPAHYPTKQRNIERDRDRGSEVVPEDALRTNSDNYCEIFLRIYNG